MYVRHQADIWETLVKNCYNFYELKKNRLDYILVIKSQGKWHYFITKPIIKQRI